VNGQEVAAIVQSPGTNGHSSVHEAPELRQTKAAKKASRLQAIDVAWLLWGERRFLVRLTATALVVCTALAFLLPKRYTATARLMPPDYTSSISTGLAMTALSSSSSEETGGGAPLMGLASKLLGFNSSGDLIVGVLHSDTLEDRIIQKFGLMEKFGTKYPEDARKMLEAEVDVQSDTKTGIITIGVERRDPREASAIAQEMVDELNGLLAQVNTSAAHRERVFIGERLQTVKQELDGATKEFSVFASQNTAINIPDQAKAMVMAAADLQGQIIGAESQLKAMQEVYTDDSPQVRQMKAGVEELRSQLNKFGGIDVDPASGGKLARNELYPSIRQLPLLGVKYLDLFRRTKIDEAAFELLSKEYEVAKVEEAREVPTVAILDAPSLPKKKSSPRRVRIMALGTIFAFVAGAGLVVGKREWQEIRPDDSRKLLADEILSKSCPRLLKGWLVGSRNGSGSELIAPLQSSTPAERNNFPNE
jgi:capsule polysaccharide export protein KpsE/RkpR